MFLIVIQISFLKTLTLAYFKKSLLQTLTLFPFFFFPVNKIKGLGFAFKMSHIQLHLNFRRQFVQLYLYLHFHAIAAVCIFNCSLMDGLCIVLMPPSSPMMS